jgi:hypothetical protein
MHHDAREGEYLEVTRDGTRSKSHCLAHLFHAYLPVSKHEGNQFYLFVEHYFHSMIGLLWGLLFEVVV